MALKDLLTPLALSLAVSVAGWGARALTAGGAAAATLVGTAILLGTGWTGGAALAAFFVGSSTVSRLIPDPTARLDAKGPRRDAWQVAANGIPAALGALLEFSRPGLGLWIVSASLAAAAADTWATSFGAMSRSWPRDILSRHPVPPGTSGGVTLAGCLGATAGAALVGGVAALAANEPRLLPATLLIGIAGMFLDSVLGSTVQARFQCPICDTPCEQERHRCGADAVHRGGWRALSNDGVNALATTAAGLGGCLAWNVMR